MLSFITIVRGVLLNGKDVRRKLKAAKLKTNIKGKEIWKYSMGRNDRPWTWCIRNPNEGEI
ncbi:hypothetical protein HM131_16710 [Halobacillus mangrovi]|uniref:Uncharacterized protein n=1 Tax=Halobacillus mangrovi TaxID=402384 RepID=A0A1W5ZYN6_9BACI|nr:hypothetical protein HM131_16710 [Halobacillus mangrovi]